MRDLLADLVGDRDHSLVVEEVGGGPGDEINVGAIVDSCLTPPFLIDRRVVVVRDAGRLLTADVPRLVEVVTNPLPSTILVLVGGGGTVPAPLSKAVNRPGQVIDVSVSQGGRSQGLAGRAPARRPREARCQAAQLLGQHVGEDLGRVEGLLSALSQRLRRRGADLGDDLEPYLGEAGGVARYELTDAIDRGDTAEALTTLHRMNSAGGLSAVEVVFTLHRHYANMLALDGSLISDEHEAARSSASRPTRPRRHWSSHAGWAAPTSPTGHRAAGPGRLRRQGRHGTVARLVVEILVARPLPPDPSARDPALK